MNKRERLRFDDPLEGVGLGGRDEAVETFEGDEDLVGAGTPAQPICRELERNHPKCGSQRKCSRNPVSVGDGRLDWKLSRWTVMIEGSLEPRQAGIR